MDDSTIRACCVADLAASLAAAVGFLPVLAHAQIGAERWATEISGVRSGFTGTVPAHVLTLEAR